MANELVGQCWLIDFPSMVMRAVLMRLSESSDPDGTNIFPSAATIADETNASLSSVRAALAAFEQCQLLEVIDSRYGNRSGRTTVVRELNTDLMRLITGQRQRGKPKRRSTHILAQVEVPVAAGQRRVLVPGAAAASIIEKPPAADTVLALWAIVPRPLAGSGRPEPRGGFAGAAEGAAEGAATDTESPPTPPGAGGVPLPEPDPTPPGAGGDPSRSWTPPLQELEGTPPGAGANTSLDSVLDSPPHPPAARGAKRGKRISEVDEALRTLRAERPDWLTAIDQVLAPVVTQRRLDAPSLEGALRALAGWITLKALTASEARQVVEALRDRNATVKPSDFEKAVKARLGLRPKPPLLAGDPALMAEWPRVLAAIERQLGRDVAGNWFSTFVPVGLDRGAARVATHVPFIARHVEQTYTAEFRLALAEAFPGVTSVAVECRRAAA